jgi:hypothetical protein
MVKTIGCFIFLSLLAATSGARADEIEVASCTGANCIPSSPSYFYLDGPTSSLIPTNDGIAPLLAAGASATDTFSWSSGSFSLTNGTVDANSALGGEGLSASLLEELSFGVTVTDSTGTAGTISIIVQQNIATPSVTPPPYDLLGESSLSGSCSSNTAGLIYANSQLGEYPTGSFNVVCSTKEFDDSASGLIPYYAADGEFYEQADFFFNADGGVSESMNLPLGESNSVPDPQIGTTPVPESPTALLLAAGLLSLTGVLRRPMSR